MGLCVYCQTKAGLFKDRHDSCSNKAKEERAAFQQSLSNTISGNLSTSDLSKELAAANAGLEQEGLSCGLWDSLDKAVLPMALENPISNEEADRLSDIYKALDPKCFENMERMAKWPGFVALINSNVIYQIHHGIVPYYDPNSFSDFRLGPGEYPILRRVAQIAEYRSIPTGRSYQSVGMPIGGGLYYRVGMSQPRSAETGLTLVDEGLILISTEALYFTGQQTTFRMPHDSILRLEAFSDGFGVHENYGRPKVIIPGKLGDFDEGWYFYNLMQALSTWSDRSES